MYSDSHARSEVRADSEDPVIPLFCVPEALLSDRGTNLLSHLMLDLCSLLGIRKLNTTAHHPQCDGMVERFNRTFKTMLQKHVAKFGTQWDWYLHGVMWAYQNVPHDSTGEKPSFLLLGVDCRSPTEVPPHDLEITLQRGDGTFPLNSSQDGCRINSKSTGQEQADLRYIAKNTLRAAPEASRRQVPVSWSWCTTKAWSIASELRGIAL